MGRREELEAAIEDDPYDPRLYAVLGDHLEEIGDPRGRLIALQLSRKGAVEDAAASYLAAHPALDAPAGAEFLWACGFARTIRIESSESGVRDILAHASTRFVTELGLHCSTDRAPQRAIDAIAESVRPTIRKLELQPRFLLQAIQGTDPNDSRLDLTTLWRALPRLEQLLLAVPFGVELGGIDTPCLTHLDIDEHRDPVGTTRALANATWPALQRLQLVFTGFTSRDEMAGELRRLLVETSLLALSHLALRGGDVLQLVIAQHQAELFAPGRTLTRLRSLDLSHTLFTDEHAALLARQRWKLDHLDVSANMLSPDGIALLGQIATTVVSDRQYGPDGGLADDIFDY